jgi:hypothetical protein
MAYKTVRETYFNSWGSYEGPYDRGVWKFYGPAEQMMPVNWAATLASIYIENFRSNGEDLMYIKVEADTTGTFETNYRVTTFSHSEGTSEMVGYVQLIVGLIAAAVIVIGLVFLSIIWYPAIKAVSHALPSLMGWALAGGVLLGSIFLLTSGNEEAR